MIQDRCEVETRFVTRKDVASREPYEDEMKIQVLFPESGHSICHKSFPFVEATLSRTNFVPLI